MSAKMLLKPSREFPQHIIMLVCNLQPDIFKMCVWRARRPYIYAFTCSAFFSTESVRLWAWVLCSDPQSGCVQRAGIDPSRCRQ